MSAPDRTEGTEPWDPLLEALNRAHQAKAEAEKE
jgi:hypothetical protein